MKNKLTLWMMAILVAVIFAGCSSDSKTDPEPEPEPEPGKGTAVQNWIVEDLSKMYLWNKDVKLKTVNYKETDYKKFFNSLLSTNREDGKHDAKNNYFYSYINEITTGASSPMRAGTFYTSFGASYYLVMTYIYDDEKEENPNDLYGYLGVQIRSIVEGSPLWKVGLRRGDYILQTNGISPESTDGQNWTGVNEFVRPLVQPTGSVNMIWGHPEDKGLFATLKDGGILHVASFGDLHESNVAPAVVEENPVHRSGVVTSGGGKKVGYIAYTGFERGEDGYYDNKLKDAVRALKSSGVTELVIDLRYNGGGYLSSCQLLTSMILSESKAGTNVMRMTYNDDLVTENPLKYNQWLPILTRAQMKQSQYGTAEGEFLGMTKLYMIISDATASASETLIHNMKGLDIPVYTIGLNTEGKNVGMTQRLSDNLGGKRYEAWPITIYMKNAKEQTFSAKGFAPDYMFDELNLINDNYVVAMKDLGDPKEALFAVALHHIDNGSFPAKTSSRSSFAPQVIKHSVKMPERPNGIRVGANDFPVEQ